MKWNGLPADYITSNFLKAVFHKFYLVHSWILCPKWAFVLFVTAVVIGMVVTWNNLISLSTNCPHGQFSQSSHKNRKSHKSCCILHFSLDFQEDAKSIISRWLLKQVTWKTKTMEVENPKSIAKVYKKEAWGCFIDVLQYIIFLDCPSKQTF